MVTFRSSLRLNLRLSFEVKVRLTATVLNRIQVAFFSLCSWTGFVPNLRSAHDSDVNWNPYSDCSPTPNSGCNPHPNPNRNPNPNFHYHARWFYPNPETPHVINNSVLFAKGCCICVYCVFFIFLFKVLWCVVFNHNNFVLRKLSFIVV